MASINNSIAQEVSAKPLAGLHAPINVTQMDSNGKAAAPSNSAAMTNITSVLRSKERLIVCCEIDHFTISGLTVSDLFSRLSPQLEVAIHDAALRDPYISGAPRSPSVRMDVDVPDPGIELWVHDPAACLENLDECFSRLEAIVARFTAADRLVDGGAA